MILQSRKISFNLKVFVILGLVCILTAFSFSRAKEQDNSIGEQYDKQVADKDYNETVVPEEKVENKKLSDAPLFKAPVCLLVGIDSAELSYNEISVLSGFELFTVPYRTDIRAVVSQLKPIQVIVKHPSGFVGLYSPEGELIRGIQTVFGTTNPPYAGFPPSIIQPTEANPIYENLFYPGTQTGSVPTGGIGYAKHPQGLAKKRHFLKLTSLLGLVPFQYPGYFMAYQTYDQEKLFPSLLLPQVPLAIGAASTYFDSRFDGVEYDQTRSQPRDYMFQPIIEGY